MFAESKVINFYIPVFYTQIVLLSAPHSIQFNNNSWSSFYII